MGNAEYEDSSGTRSVCDMDLRKTEILPAGEIEKGLRLGDILLFRRQDDWLTRSIAALDGYWTHAAIYVGDGNLVHAQSKGVHLTPVDMVLSYYAEGAAVARPNVRQSSGVRAAVWAKSIAESDSRFSGWELGLGYALLRRAQAQGNWRKLEPPDETLESLGLWDTPDDHAFTCSGFVFTSYSQGAEDPLAIEPAPGLVIRDGMLIIPDEPTLYDAIVEDGKPIKDLIGDDSETRAPVLEGTKRPSFTKWLNEWRAKGPILAQAAVAWAVSGVSNPEIPLEQGVTPGDLWCSPSMSDRWFLSSDSRDMAREATEGCESGRESNE